MSALYTPAHLATPANGVAMVGRPRTSDAVEPHRRNALLRAVPEDEYTRLLRPHLELVALEAHDVLIEPRTPIQFVCFPHTCVLSLIAYDAAGAPGVEVQMLGREGMAGLPLLHGVSAGPHRCVTQIRGDASQLSAAAFHIALVRGPALRALMHRYADSALVATAQSAVCDSLHDVRARCARWLLEACDRVAPEGPRFGNGIALRPSVTFRLTQEALGHQLNARRASVSQACAQLRDDGVISYTRGSITVLDRDALEASACSCYGIVRAAYDAVFAAP